MWRIGVRVRARAMGARARASPASQWPAGAGRGGCVEDRGKG